jgi:hypothetical protein
VSDDMDREDETLPSLTVIGITTLPSDRDRDDK